MDADPGIRVTGVMLGVAALGCSPVVNGQPTPGADTHQPAPSPDLVFEPVELTMGALTVADDLRALATFTWDEYTSYAQRFGGGAVTAPWLSDRSGLPDDARFGFNAVVASINRSFAVSPRAEGGVTLWLDLDGDGRLGEHEASVVGDEFVPLEVGQPPIPILVRWSGEDGEQRLGLRSTHAREAQLELAGVDVAVRLVGAAGSFDRQSHAIFDFDADGEFDAEPLHDERFRVEDPQAYVSIADGHWGLSTDPAGSQLTLTRRTDVLGPRPPVTLGQTAPDFRFGEDRRTLSQLRGHPVLLEFFAPGCSFCVEAGPELRAAFADLGPSGVEFVSIDNDGVGDEARAFALEHGKRWPLALGAAGDIARSLYRVEGVPTYVVVAADGTMIARGSWRDLGESIQSGAIFSTSQR